MERMFTGSILALLALRAARLGLFARDFLEQLVHGLIQFFIVNVARADDAFGVENVDRRPTRDVPFAGDRARGAAAVPPGAPGDLLFLEYFLKVLLVRIAIDAEEDERFAFQPFDERPLVRVHGPARPSPMPPEIEHD